MQILTSLRTEVSQLLSTRM